MLPQTRAQSCSTDKSAIDLKNWACAHFSSLSGLKPSPSWLDSLSDSLRSSKCLGVTVAIMAGRRPHGDRGSPSPSWPDTLRRRVPGVTVAIMASRRPHGAQGVTVAIMARYVFRRHHGRLPSVVEPRRDTVAIMAG